MRCSTSFEGSSDYQLNNKAVTYNTYNEAFQEEYILIQAKSLLVFRRDVGAITSQSPKGLIKPIERISGSLALAREYQDAINGLGNGGLDVQRNPATAEIKQRKEQETEMDRSEKLLDERVREVLFGPSHSLHFTDYHSQLLQANA
jgi:structural maintenance of chromosome 1